MKRPTADALALMATAAVVTALLVLGFVVLNRESSAELAVDARTSILAEGTLSAASAVRNATTQSLVIASSSGQVVANPALLDAGLAAIGAMREELESRFAALRADVVDVELVSLAAAFTSLAEATDRVVASIRAGEVEEAALDSQAQSRAYEDFTAQVAELRDSRTEEILLAARGVGRASDAVRFLMVFLLPFGVVVSYRRRSRRREDQRQLAEELSRQRDITRSKDEFIADLSHELRTPLTGIYGFALALEEVETKLPTHSREMLSLIIAEAAELSRMVDDLIAAGRLDAGEIRYAMEDVELEQEISEVVEPFRRRGVAITVDGANVSVRADRFRLRQLLRNLVSNGAKHGGESIVIRVSGGDDTVRIQVVDDGPGVPEELVDRLFGRYVHADGEALLAGSVGLGLAIARSFSEGMGGSLRYRRIDGWTMFEVRLRSTEAIEHTAPVDLEVSAEA